ncbi:MAG TPA: DUF885 domain-containing protein [Gammaproteobacteria bacterium]|nr:DUF885 domain-containing protein [Gammaproteobacteria bacterium]
MSLRAPPILGLALSVLAAALGACGGKPAPAAGEPPTARAGAPAQPASDAETARLNEWLDARFEEELTFSPIRKTRLGRKDDYDKIDDVSEAAGDAQLAWRRATVAELRRAFDYAKLSPEGKTSYDLWVYGLEQAERETPFRRRVYTFHQMDAQQTALPQFLINYHRVDDAADMRAYVARIGGVARAIDQLVQRAKLAAGEGVHAPRFAYAEVLRQARALVTGAPFAGAGDAPVWADAKAKIDALAAAGKIDAAAAGELRAAARTALLEKFKPSYDALIAWVESDQGNSDEVATGVWKLPDGPAFYAERLVDRTTTDMSAEEIHELGLREVERIKGEMDAIRRRVGFAGTLPEFFEFMRKDPRFRFPNTDEGREAYLTESRADIAAVRALLPKYFGLLPKADLVVKRVEAFREQPGAAQHYQQGTPDGSKPGTYYVHLIDMNAMPRPELESVAYHEGIPGHHLQIAIQQELTGVPKFRTQLFFTAYVEGWGLYAERLAKEMGRYEDPYSDFGRLSAELWRAIRLVVDTGLHAKRWTEQQAVEYFTANSPIAEGQIRSEVRRYIVLPGQATTYKIGMLKILELRARAQAALGDKFDIRAFHDVVLGGGALPLSILERRVDEWIAASGGRGAN